MTEQWRPVVGWEGIYSVSDQGRVFSHQRFATGARGPRVVNARILKTNRRLSGHLQVDLKANGRKRRGAAVHRLVLEAFVGACPDGMEALHFDDDPTNNRLSNLRYGTRSENLYDMVRNGRHQGANQTHCKHGHEYTPENTWINSVGRRECRTCIHDRRVAARKGRQIKTHCPVGHPYDEANTYLGTPTRPRRACRRCATDQAAKRRERLEMAS